MSLSEAHSRMGDISQALCMVRVIETRAVMTFFGVNGQGGTFEIGRLL